MFLFELLELLLLFLFNLALFFLGLLVLPLVGVLLPLRIEISLLDLMPLANLLLLDFLAFLVLFHAQIFELLLVFLIEWRIRIAGVAWPR